MRTLLFAALNAVTIVASATDQYSVEDLSGLFPPGASSRAVDIADNGTVTGTVVGSGERDKPFVLAADGNLAVFDLGFYDDRRVHAGNGDGLVVGAFPGTTVGWVRVGPTLRCIPTPLDCGSFDAIYSSSAAYDVNDAGRFVGALTIIQPGQPYRFEAYRGRVVGTDIETERLGRWQQTQDTVATAIDAAGTIVGFAIASAAGAIQQPLVLRGEGWVALGQPGRNYRPAALNSAGHVVGSGRSADGQRQFALRWRLDTPAADAELLPALPGAGNAWASAVNDDGVIVGASVVGSGPLDTRAWIIDGAAITPLNDLLINGTDWRIIQANAINADGAIAAVARRTGMPGTRAVVLRPVPAPMVFMHGFDGD